MGGNSDRLIFRIAMDHRVSISRKLGVLLLLMQLAIAIAGDQQTRMLLPECTGRDGSWRKDADGKAKAWIMKPPCKWRMGTTADVQRYYRGAYIVVAGDSVSRMFFYELALWLSGCEEPVEQHADARKCHEYAANRMNRDPRVIYIPRVGVTIEFMWVTHVHYMVEMLPIILSKGAHIFILSTGFWHMRHPVSHDVRWRGAAHNCTRAIVQLIAVASRTSSAVIQLFTRYPYNPLNHMHLTIHARITAL